MAFKKAERKQAKLKLAMTGPSGSGKTFSALRLAKGLGGRIALIDTENKSASLYSDRFDFDVLEIEPPYTNEKYLAALQEAERARYDILIIDSLTHQWAGAGGLLNQKEQMDARGGNSFANWAKMTSEHEKFKSAIVHSDMHIIGTMRSKTEYAIGEKDGGKGTTVKRMGMAPIQRDGFEYEFTVVFDIAINHEAEASKDRTNLFAGKIFQVTEETGKILGKWISEGTANVVPALPSLKAAPAPLPPIIAGKPKSNILKSRSDQIVAVMEPMNWPKGTILTFCEWAFGAPLAEITEQAFQRLLDLVKNKTYAQAYEEVKAKPEPGGFQDFQSGPVITPKKSSVGEK